MSNIEGMYSIYFYKKMERSDSILRNSIFVIRYSAVRCSARLPAAKATSLIIKKPCYFREFSSSQLGTKVIKSESWGKRSQYPQGFGLDNRLLTIFYIKLLVNVVQVSFDSFG
jgi:hypothetical protein